MKKTNNKGFSLVELIVVIAIMAVLMVVLGPQLLRNVEKARIQRDNSAISEIANAAKIAMAEQTVYDYVGTLTDDTATIKIENGSVTFGTNALEKELSKTIAPTVTLTANTYSDKTVTMTVKINGDNVEVSATGMYKSDGTAEAAAVKF